VAELALGFPFAGALVGSLLRRRHRLALLACLAFGLAGLVAAVTARPERATLAGLDFQLAAPVQAILVVSFLAAGLAVLLAPAGADRVALAVSGLGGLAAIAAVAVLGNPVLVALAVLLTAGVHAALPALRSFGERVRAPAFGALLLVLAALLTAGTGSLAGARIAGLALVLGVTAAIGLAPYLGALDPREPAPASPVAWLGFLGPTLVVVMATRLSGGLSAEAGDAYAAVLIGLGIFNLGLGALGGWRSKPGADLWRYSFLGDWGLVLVGLGLLSRDGFGAASLLLVSILLLRLPLYLLARPALVKTGRPELHAAGLLVAAALAGSAPFAGFAARLLLLRSASAVAWPLALFLAVAMLSWLPLSIRLAQTFGRPGRRVTFGVALLLVINLAVGLYPAFILKLVGAS